MAKQEQPTTQEKEPTIVHREPAVRMKAPEGSQGLHHDGKLYPVENGHVTIPTHAMHAALSHGFKTAE